MLHALIEQLPPIVQRRRVAELTYGLVNACTLANLDSKGLGPEDRMKLAGRVVYSKDSFAAWLLNQIEPAMEHNRTGQQPAGQKQKKEKKL